MSNMKIVELIDANNVAVKAQFDAEIARAIELIEGELVSVDTKIAVLTDRVRRLEEAGVSPETSA
jgi:VIT1/CCC1 family predicted Fe2+/Mn2+ transporter